MGKGAARRSLQAASTRPGWFFRKAEWMRSGSECAILTNMTKAKQPGAKAKKKGGFVIGRESFGKISAVEGIRLTPAMKKRAADAERKGLSAEEYRRTIVRSYREA